MFKRKSIKFLNLTFLVLTLIMGSIVPSFASEGKVILLNDSKITIQLINDKSVIINENDERTLITKNYILPMKYFPVKGI